MDKLLKPHSIIATLMLTCACTAQPSAIDWVDMCSRQHAAFADVVACAKQNRNAGCTKDGYCSTDDDAVIAYADSLAASVKKRTMSEEEAKRKWLDFRFNRRDAEQSRMLQQRAIMAAERPITCTRTGPYTHCF